jgi:hypothetical protein
VAAGQQGQAASQRTVQTPQRGRVGEATARRTAPGGPAFISDEAEEQHHHDVLRDPRADDAAKATARLELARLYERRGAFAEAVEMYEQNIWAGARTPATFAGLAGAYRELGRDDLADAALEQVRRHGGAGRAPATATTGAPTRSFTRSRPSRSRSAADPTRRVNGARTTSRTSPRGQAEVPTPSAALGQLQRSVAPFLEGQAGRRTLVVSTVLLPIVVGLGIFAAVVLTSTRNRSAEPAPAPTPAPVATVAPTPVPTAAPTSTVPAALSQAPAPARLVVNNVGPDGLSLRRSPNTTGQRIKVWNDGTEMADLGETAEGGGKNWRKLRDPEGNVGWAAAEFLTDPATRAASAAPAAPSFASGGLGLTRAEWEKAHGQPSRSSIFLEYDGGRLVVGLLEGNVWHVERVWMRGDAVSLEDSREDARAYLPEDATQVQSLDKGDGRIVDVYTSSSLTGRFGSTAWNGGKAGTFSIQYRFRSPADRMVTSAIFRLGDAQF